MDPSEAETAKSDSFVEAELRFLEGAGDAPSTFGHAPSSTTIGFVKHKTRVFDGRRHAREASLDRQGFALIRHQSHVTDFYDEGAVRSLHYLEAADLIKAETGAASVCVLSHSIRTSTIPPDGRGMLRAPATFMHNDYTACAARALLAACSTQAASERRRFAVFHLWRPIRGPLQTNPLVLGDGSSFEAGDIVPAAHSTGDAESAYLVIRFNPAQRWFYFPDMQPDEAILLKCHDSDPSRTPFSGHGAMDDSMAPQNALPRESIEVRAIAFFEET